MRESKKIFAKAKRYDVNMAREASGKFGIMTKLEKVLFEYIEFLRKANEQPVNISYAHGWRCDPFTIAKGQEFRFNIMLEHAQSAVLDFPEYVTPTGITFSPVAIYMLEAMNEGIIGYSSNGPKTFMGLRVIEEPAYDDFHFTIK